ncbi:hypothetical protein [Dokdonella fugitiva]|jgi:hypothetical protein|uniref:hypothetical protein n=1 Tax=Dokdonella fugitiva TaxID=328517 RepID=UPI0015FA9491|nr:hypothetical protein [Dokdonella fugitiva]MBA8882859.1 hypothetical protein [Dokdonella fugitiva]
MRRLLRKLRSWLPRRPCRIERYGRACIAVDRDYPVHVRAYYRHCAGLFAAAFARQDAAVNVIFGPRPVRFGNALPTLRIDLQPEHTLVRPGGRDSGGAPVGVTPLPDGSGCYLVRLADEAYLRSLDTIVEYSLPNVVNVRSSGHFDELAARTALVAPLLYPPRFDARGRDIAAISLMFDERQPRRRRFLDDVRRASLPLRNVRGVFDAAALRRLYDRTRVLVNVHQTAEHHTFEELRVLPALLRGVVVISEDVPLRERIPYHDAIIWRPYEAIVDTVRDVLARFDEVRATLFGDALAATFAAMERENRANVEAAVRRMLAARG